MKKLKSIGVVVFCKANAKSRVNSDWNEMPSVVQTYINKNKNLVPYVVITTPDTTEKFAGYSHKHLSGGDYVKIFREAKKKIREAKKAGRLSSVTSADTGESKETESKTDTITKTSTEGQTIVIVSPATEQWISSSDTTLQAKLMSVEKGQVCIFKTAKGKSIKVKLDQLSTTSADRVRELMELNTK